jgi:uncharacterized protein (TIGR03435 family)
VLSLSRAFAVAVLFATGVAAAPEFSVASIKPSQLAHAGGEGSGREQVAISPTGVTLTNASLSFCVQWAYNVRPWQVSGPDRLTLDRYDVIAKTDQPTGKEQLMAMMQTLLADRFQLKLHRETRPIPVYELVAPAKPVGLHASTSDQPNGLIVLNGSFVFSHVTMPEFAAHLGDLSAFDRPVIDKTGIEGAFDITLDSAARNMREDPSSMFSAIEKAGFRLNSRKDPVEVLVIDHSGPPTPN